MSKRVWDVVRGAGYLTAIFSKLVQAMERIGGTQEQLHRLSTDQGNQTIELMAEIATRESPRIADIVMRPGVCICWHKEKEVISFTDEHGFFMEVWGCCKDHKNDKKIVSFLKNYAPFSVFIEWSFFIMELFH